MSGIMQLLLSGRPQVASDPYFEYTTLLLPGNGTNGAQNNTFLDSSTNAFSITRNGNPTQGTFSPFSQTGWGNYFDGSGDYLSGPTNNAVATFTGDFTIEAWCYFNSIAADNTIAVCMDAAAGEVGWIFRWKQTATQGFRFYSSALGAFDFAYVPPVGQWLHVAVSRSGTSLRCFVNGTQIGTTLTASGTVVRSSVNPLAVGGGPYAAPSTNGYLSNVRIVNGTAVYTANFTPPTTPLTAITNTSLLTCQSNRFIDNSSNNFTITRNGDVSVQAFSPFNPTAAWSAATNGGSGYFDGTGDYLQTVSSSLLALSGDFTVESWLYYTGTATGLTPAILYNSSTSGVSAFELNNGSTYISVAGIATTDTVVRFTLTGASIGPGEWVHVAFVRSSNVIKAYVNGVAVATTLSNSATTGEIVQIANGRSAGAGGQWVGYMAGYRIVSSAVYTTNFTPPTAPPTAITNTRLLANFTNAGIYDATSKNDLETVGNAQISTTQSKFGGSSMYFDGAGDVVRAPSSNLYDFGSGDWTMEFWMYTGNVSTRQDILDRRASATITGWMLSMSIVTAARLTFYASGPGWPLMTSNTNIASNTWTHVAIVRYGSSFKMYQNGIEVASATSSSAMSDNNYYFQVGNSIDNIYYTGYINDLRVTKGYARYTTNFTPPTAAFPLL